jgi:O-antigen/teichoic acid export membrane protein
VAATIVRVVLLLALIPRFGLMGACYELLISQLIQVALWERSLAKLGYSLPLFEIAQKLSLAGAAMGMVL